MQEKKGVVADMKKKNNAKAYPYLIPALISIFVVTVLPIVYTVVISFTNYNMFHLASLSFVGITQYKEDISGSI